MEAGEAGPRPEPARGPWTAEKIAEQEATAQEYLARVGRTRQDEIEYAADLLNLKVIEGGGKKVRPPKRRPLRLPERGE